MKSQEHTFLGAILTERVFVVKNEKKKKKWKWNAVSGMKGLSGVQRSITSVYRVFIYTYNVKVVQ